ncbi:MAG: tyrosine--tRNA ligase [Ruminococcaceae bacterium]|nr:tyrosine--tRNA ligase [Oscillospiraceae bacterium]
MLNVYDILVERGIVEQTTDEEKIRELLGEEKVTFYIGFDATADSLHVGHFMQLAIMRLMQKAGHTPIALIGGGTTLVGDPSGRSDMRSMMTYETIDHNVSCFKKQMSKFLDIGDDKLIFVNNGDWLRHLNYIEFIREYGVHFSVNRMLAADAFKTRMERGLSFFELNYMVMQSYDFLHLFREYRCQIQMGGNDQWSNIISGVDLIRKVERKEAYGMTFKLLTTKEGVKMGKTAKGALWLDPEKTTPYEFYQYWRNTADTDVVNCLKLLTDIPMDEINRIEKLEGEEINNAKKLLAYYLTELVHNKEEADKAVELSEALFSGAGNADSMPETEISEDSIDEIGFVEVIDLLVMCGLTSSKGEGRRLIHQGGISIDGETVTELFKKISREDLRKGIVIKKGKKVFHRAILI